MITFIRVDGFRSLSSFEFGLRPGLNVLVGPNGAGKTNILAFLEFLGDLTRHGLTQAIARAGGAGLVFRKTGATTFVDEVSIEVHGYVSLNHTTHLHYVFEAKLALVGDPPLPQFRNQRFRAKVRDDVPNEKATVQDSDLDIEQTNAKSSSKVKVATFTNRIRKYFDAPYFALARKSTAAREEVERLLGYFSHEGENLISAVDRLQSLSAKSRSIYADFSGGTIFNVVPSRARVEQDLGAPVGIAKDGSGLYSTLFAISRRDSSFATSSVSRLPPSLAAVSMSRVNELLRLANGAIDSLNIKSDPFDNKLTVRVSFSRGKQLDSTQLPLSSLSDGTIKWLCLVLVSLSTDSLFSVEEPENYMHPRLQKEFLDLIRNSVDKKQSVLLSTHSQSLIDQCEPSEIVVVRFTNDRTTAMRPNNLSELEDEIRATGFGLGHYYVAGALDPID